MKRNELTKEEKEILESFEKDEWVPLPDGESEIGKHKRYARNTLKKDRRINIRISSKDLETLQLMAVEDGLPYQTLISSILHRYVSGRSRRNPDSTKILKLNKAKTG